MCGMVSIYAGSSLHADLPECREEMLCMIKVLHMPTQINTTFQILSDLLVTGPDPSGCTHFHYRYPLVARWCTVACPSFYLQLNGYYGCSVAVTVNSAWHWRWEFGKAHSITVNHMTEFTSSRLVLFTTFPNVVVLMLLRMLVHSEWAGLNLGREGTIFYMFIPPLDLQYSNTQTWTV